MKGISIQMTSFSIEVAAVKTSAVFVWLEMVMRGDMFVYHWATVGPVHWGSVVGSVVAAVPWATLIRESHSIVVSILTWSTWSSGTL